MLQQVLRRLAQFNAGPAPQRQRGEQQGHTDHRAGYRQIEYQTDGLARQLKQQEQRNRKQHGASPDKHGALETTPYGYDAPRNAELIPALLAMEAMAGSID